MSMHTVAVMGLGVRGKIHLHGLLENPDYYKVVGLCDIDEPKMKAVAEEYHLDGCRRDVKGDKTGNICICYISRSPAFCHSTGSKIRCKRNFL